MAECRKYRDMISCYADGELHEIEKEELAGHLEECASCRSLLSLYMSITEAAAESLIDPPESFTESVMDRIKTLSGDKGADTHSGSGRKRPIKPFIITFAAAAACLALVLITAPGLFGLKSANDFTANAPMPEAGFDAASADDQDILMRSYEDGAAGDSAENAGGSDTVNQSMAGITAASAEPKGANGETTTPGSIADELKVYYAVFLVEGQLTEILEAQVMSDNGDGTFNIEISADMAERLIADGLSAYRGAPESVIALVVYTPES